MYVLSQPSKSYWVIQISAYQHIKNCLYVIVFLVTKSGIGQKIAKTG